jgi:acyl carrier protein
VEAFASLLSRSEEKARSFALLAAWQARNPALDPDAALSYRRLPREMAASAALPNRPQHLPPINKGCLMPVEFDRVADIIAETASIPRETITPDSHVIDDLGIDSLDFLDIVFALDKEYGINIPFEDWMQQVNAGEAKASDFFIMNALVGKIDGLVAAKNA